MDVYSPGKEHVYVTSPKQRIDAKNAAYRMKYGSPKLRDLLREKCRIRVKEARGDSFNRFRTTDKNIFNTILKQELATLNYEIELQERLYEELQNEYNDWFIEELERQDEYLIQQMDKNSVVCPICQKSTLELENFKIVCDCGVKFDGKCGLENVTQLIEMKCNDHASKCNKQLSFFIEPHIASDLSTLNVICEFCDYYNCLF